MSQSKLVWLSKPKNKSSSYSLTARPNQKRILPLWMEKLECNEVFVNRVPTLKNIACASIIANETFKTFDEFDTHAFNLFGDELIQVINTDCNNHNHQYCHLHICIPGYLYIEANKVLNVCKTIYHAFPYAVYDIIDRKDCKRFNFEQLEVDRKRKQSIKRKLSFTIES